MPWAAPWRQVVGAEQRVELQKMNGEVEFDRLAFRAEVPVVKAR